MDKHELVARVHGWAEAITGEAFPEDGVKIASEYVGSFPKFPQTVNDEPVREPRRHVRVRVRLSDRQSLPVRKVAAWSEAIRRAVEADRTLGGAVGEQHDVRAEFREEDATVEVTATVPDEPRG